LIATSVLALSFPETVIKSCGSDIQQRAAKLFYETSAVEAGLATGEFHRHTQSVTAMHDATEGGVLGAIYELAHASGCGVVVNEPAIPLDEPQQKIGALFNIDPLYCVGAGAMIITAKADKAHLLVEHLAANNVRATVIGAVTAPSEGLKIHRDQEVVELQHPGADPYWSAFFDAFGKGWK
jgi:hydrogenase expression/formation protein HypE